MPCILLRAIANVKLKYTSRLVRKTMNDLNKKLRCGVGPSFVCAATLSLFGCGGGDGGESSTGQSSDIQLATVSAQDATFSTGYSELFEVDLSPKVFSSTGGGFILTDVESLSDESNCQIENITDSGFVIQASDTKVCSYRYHVAPKSSTNATRHSSASLAMSEGSSESSSSAITRVAVSSDPRSTELVPVSAVTLVDKEIEVSLKADLSKVGFPLDDEFTLTQVTTPNGRASSVQISDSDDQVIEYTPPPGFTGIDRVLYTLEDSANERVLMGVLDIAVGYEANQGFTIHDNIEYPSVVNVLTETEIDISDFVTSDDGDDYQLVYVGAFNAKANTKDPLDITNKVITFEASQSGFHYISFAVSDHNGVYDMGLIRVEVTDPNQSSKWGDISHLLDVYIGPPTALDAAGQGSRYDIKLNDSAYSPAIDMAGYRYPSAVAYCETSGGAVPTLVQLTLMANDTDVQLFHNWPVQGQYLAYDDVQELPMWVDLTDGNTRTGNVDPTSAYYVTCVQQGLIDVLPISSTQAVADGVDVGSVFFELKIGQEVRPDTIVTAYVSSPNVTLNSQTVTTDSNGIAEFRLTSFKAETVTLTIDVAGISKAYEVKFIGDEKTASVSSEVTIDNVTYSSVEGDEVTATLTDQNSNPVEGYSITSEVSAGVHPDTAEVVTPILEAETTQTDESGEQKVRVKWDSQYETPKSDMTFDVTSSYTTTEGKHSESTSKVTFNAHVCGGQVGDDDKANAAGHCIKVAENGGKLYTGNPSVPFLQAIDYAGYGLSYTESGSQGPSGGVFAIFNRFQADQLCTQYNNINLKGKSNWRLATKEELDSLYRTYSNMFAVKGWAAGQYSWSSTPGGSSYYRVSLLNGEFDTIFSPFSQFYASCVSGS